ncbi:MAG TPA: hypothetical protein VK915_07430 [Gaiellaceae bacterium]|nr:hypothetical protein [Gaiellaceae bacterium]
MDADDRLRLDYDQTTQALRTLTDVRFRLLAFVPAVSGAAVALLNRPRPAAELLGVGVLGLVATAGVFVYELRNSQISATFHARAQALERRLGLGSAADAPGGLFSERPGITQRLAGFFPVSHGNGLALVYAAALGGWGYLVGWGLLAAVGLDAARGGGAVVGFLVGAGVLWQLVSLGQRR